MLGLLRGFKSWLFCVLWSLTFVAVKCVKWELRIAIFWCFSIINKWKEHVIISRCACLVYCVASKIDCFVCSEVPRLSRWSAWNENLRIASFDKLPFLSSCRHKMAPRQVIPKDPWVPPFYLLSSYAIHQVGILIMIIVESQRLNGKGCILKRGIATLVHGIVTHT